MTRTTIPAELVAINAIQGTLIADNAITAVHIATNAVSGTLVADNAITSTHIAQNNVTATQIAQNTITVTQMADSAIETAKINNDAVTQAKIADDAVGPDQLAANAVVSASIANGTIVEADMADNAVTLAKMAGLARGKIIYGDSAGDPAALAIGSSGTVLSSDGTDVSWGAASSTFATLTDTTVATSDPATNTNPSTGVGTLYLNKNSGNMWCCTDATSNANAWTNIGYGSVMIGSFPVTGGTTSTAGGYTFHTFTSSGTLSAPVAKSSVDILIVAGGGDGGGGEGGGGDGGGGEGAGCTTSAIRSRFGGEPPGTSVMTASRSTASEIFAASVGSRSVVMTVWSSGDGMTSGLPPGVPVAPQGSLSTWRRWTVITVSFRLLPSSPLLNLHEMRPACSSREVAFGEMATGS